MNLFQFKENKVVFSPQALALKPFKALWTRDRDKNKKNAFAELAYVYYFCDYASDYSKHTDEAARHSQIMTVIDLPKDWKPDTKVLDAIALYKEGQKSLAIDSLHAARVAVVKVNNYLVTVDLGELDKNGKPIHKVKDIDDSVGKIFTRLEQLNKVEAEVKKQIESKTDSQGSMIPALFENGIPSA